jgi:hypothetical protein
MNTLNGSGVWLLILTMVWVLPWKGYALWTAARANNKRWFIAIVILNTLAILDIFYIFYIAKKTPKDIINAFKSSKI